MEDSTDVVAKLKPKKRGPGRYKNVTTNNVFTEVGRCAPGKSVKLTAAQAKAYGDSLEKC